MSILYWDVAGLKSVPSGSIEEGSPYDDDAPSGYALINAVEEEEGEDDIVDGDGVESTP
jgi:hypothetical protein